MAKREKKSKNKVLRAILLVLLALVLVVASYVIYVLVDYHRIEDNLALETVNPKGVQTEIATGEDQKIISWNIGFAAYKQDYSFFMDGGKESRARSKEDVLDSMKHITEKMEDFDANLYLMQEVDFDSTRSYKVDQRQLMYDAFPSYSHTFAQNYDSAYLFYPLTEPIGASKSGLVSLSQYKMESSLRRSLPIQTDFAKFIDLDRCYDIIRIPASNGKQLVLVNLHLSAYTTDDTIAEKQLTMLYKDIEKERALGNYVICGGDFNRDIVGDSGKVFGIEGEDVSWCQPFKEENLPEGFSLVKPYKKEDGFASCRDTSAPYDKKTSFRCTLDAFVISDNIQMKDTNVIETDYMWTDHNPIYMNFVLK